jgi:uncharacterized protein YdeI (YjbR/CyaY-like superfamily)
MHPEVDAYIARAKQWQAEIQLLRTILLDCKLEETIKWGQPCYTMHDKNIVIIAPFKAHCDLGFFNGVLLKDTKGVLLKPGANTQASRQLRFKNINEIEKLKSVIISYVKEAIKNEVAGLKPTLEKPEAIVVEELDAIFKKNAPLKKAFTALTPGRQRAYLIYFSGAKQSETRINRINHYRQRILSGIGINDCTCGLSKRMPTCDGSHKQLNLKK